MILRKELLLVGIFITATFVFATAQSKKYVDDLIDKSWEQSFTNVDSAELVIKQAIEIAEEKNYLKQFASAQCYQGIYLDMKGDSDEALKLFLNSVQIQRKLKDDAGLGFTYTNIGLLYYAQYDYENAIKYVKKSLFIKKKLKDLDGMAGCYANLSIFYINLGNQDEALRFANRAGGVFQDLNDTLGYMSSLSTCGRIYMETDKFKEALEVFLSVKSLLESYPNNYHQIITNYISIGTAYNELGEMELAEENLLKALDYSKKLGSTERRLYCYEELHQIALKRKEYKSAYSYLLNYSDLRNEMLNAERTKSINELQVKYDVAEKDKLLSEQQRKQSLLIIGSVLLMVIVLFLIYVYILKRKLSRSLKDRNEVIQNNLNQKEVMINEIHHRVKNNLQLVSSILALKANSLSDPESIKALMDSKEKIFSMSQLHQFLYEQDNIDAVNLKMYIEELVAELSKAFKKEDQECFYNLDVFETANVSVDMAVSLGLIINELVNNIFKHSVTEKDEVEFTITLHDVKNGEFQLIISDVGKGSAFSKEELIQRSFGLKMVDSLIRQLNGTWNISNKNGLSHSINFQSN